MVLTSLTAELKQVTRTVPRKDDPEKTDNISVPKRILVLNISGAQPGNYAIVIKELRENLKSSTSLGPKLEDIIVSQSQESGKLGDEKVVSYKINCNFKTGL